MSDFNRPTVGVSPVPATTPTFVCIIISSLSWGQCQRTYYTIHDAMNHILLRDRCFIYNVVYRMAWYMSNVKGRNNVSCLTRRAQGNELSLTYDWEGSGRGDVGSNVKCEGQQEWRAEESFHFWLLWVPRDGECWMTCSRLLWTFNVHDIIATYCTDCPNGG